MLPRHSALLMSTSLPAPRARPASLAVPPLVALVACLVLCGPVPLEAQVAGQDQLQVGLGYLDVSDRHGEAASLELTYRHAGEWLWRLRPHLGAAAFTDGSLYAHLGIHLFVPLGARLALTPAFGPGLFRSGRDVDLGSALEFRSSLGVGFQVAPGHWLSLYLYHLSNAGIGDRNPGIEVLGLGYAFRP